MLLDKRPKLCYGNMCVISIDHEKNTRKMQYDPRIKTLQVVTECIRIFRYRALTKGRKHHPEHKSSYSSQV